MMFNRIEPLASTLALRPADAFIRRMSYFASLAEADVAALALVSSRARTAPAHTDLVQQDGAPERAMILLDGFACRYRHLNDGGRQILSFLLPGDLCDFDCALFGRMDHAVAALTRCNVAWVSSEVYNSLQDERPQIASAFHKAKLAEQAIMRDWVVGLGRRRAPERLAHLFCELLDRLQVVGYADARGCDLPITQIELSDATGLSAVHISRSLQALKLAGLIQISAKRLQVLDLARLHAFCEFTPARPVQSPAFEPQRVASYAV